MSDHWYYTKGKQQTGPVDFTKLKELATTGQIAATDLVWKAGMLSWLPASDVPGLLSEGPPPVPDVQAWFVLLEWFQADKKIALIKELQRLAGVPISQGKQLLEQCPCLIHTLSRESEAYSLKAALEAIGAGVSLWNDRAALGKRCSDIPQIKAREKKEADKQRQKMEQSVRDFSKWIKSGGMQADFDGCGPCTKCGHIFQMYFANAVCPKCNYKMSREDAFFSCGSYPHSTPPGDSKSATTSSTTTVPSASETEELEDSDQPEGLTIGSIFEGIYGFFAYWVCPNCGRRKGKTVRSGPEGDIEQRWETRYVPAYQGAVLDQVRKQVVVNYWIVRTDVKCSACGHEWSERVAKDAIA